jgi:hypothetical protein
MQPMVKALYDAVPTTQPDSAAGRLGPAPNWEPGGGTAVENDAAIGGGCGCRQAASDPPAPARCLPLPLRRLPILLLML